MAFETRQLTVAKLFSSAHVFEFPSFQRPYRWTVDDAETLLEDLAQACAEHAKGTQPFPYFLGSIVLTRRTERQFAVIDGRQRLTTLFILLAVLRDLEVDPALKRGIQRFIHDDPDPVNRVEEGDRLRLSAIDADEFRAWIASPEATTRARGDDDEPSERHQRFMDVAAAFRRRLSGATGEEPLAEGPALLDFLLHRCELISVTASDEAQGIRLFRVLNSRGVELSETDQLRSDLLGELPPAEQTHAAEGWDRLDASLGARDLDRMLRALAFIFDGTWMTDKDWSSRLTTAIARRGIAKFHAEDLADYGEAMLQLARGELPYSDDKRNPNDLVRGLSWLGRREGEWSEWMPLALELVRRAAGDEDRIYNLIRALDRTFYVMFINNVGEENRRRVTAQILAEVAAGRDPMAASGTLAPPPERLRLALDKLRQPFDRFNVRGALARRAEAAMLAKRGAGLPPTIDRATVEHVLPQSPHPRSHWRRDFPGRAHRDHYNLLGNAILLNRGLDGSIGNGTFAEKRRAYVRYRNPPPFDSARDVARYNEWTQATVTERTKQVADLLAETWRF